MVFASFQSRPIEFFAFLITPLRWAVRLVADWVTTLIVGRERIRANIVTEDMVRTLAREAVGEGVLAQAEAQYIDHIFDFGNKTVGEVMTPRSSIFFLTAETPLREIVQELRRIRHTRVPIYSEHRDNILGILYARDLLGLDPAVLASSNKSVVKWLREPFFVPESKLATDLFHIFRKRKLSLALKVDEYGGVTGLISMEDLLECIFGDLPSASDIVIDEEYRKLADGSTRIDAGMSIEQFNGEFHKNLPEEGSETVGGVVLDRFGELPSIGSTIVVEGVEFVVEKIENNRIQELVIRNMQSDAGQDQYDAEEAAAKQGDSINGASGSYPELPAEGKEKE